MNRAGSATLFAVVVLSIGATAQAQRGARNGEWLSHGGDDGHIQYAALNQIDGDNLADLKVVWRWSSVDAALRERQQEVLDRSARIFFHEVTPLKVDDTLYASTSLGQIAAIDPGTGETRWSVDPEVWRAGRPANLGFLSKGLACWTDGDAGLGRPSPARAGPVFRRRRHGRLDPRPRPPRGAGHLHGDVGTAGRQRRRHRRLFHPRYDTLPGGPSRARAGLRRPFRGTAVDFQHDSERGGPREPDLGSGIVAGRWRS